MVGIAGLAGSARREAGRWVRRATNGARLIAGVDAPPLYPTPRDLVWHRDRAELHRYRSDDRRTGPPILLVMSLVTRPYVFDLAPGYSFVETLLGEGFDVFGLDWGVPGPADAANTLETYTLDYLPDAVRAVCDVSGADDVTLIGYCMGGLLSVLSTAANDDLPVANLIALATPIDATGLEHFSHPLVRSGLPPEEVLDHDGNVPAATVLRSFQLQSPLGDVTQFVTLVDKLWDDRYVGQYQVMNRWLRDHIPFPGATFLQLHRDFNLANGIMEGTFHLGGQRLDLASIRCPFVHVVAERDEIVPLPAAAPLVGLVGSDDKEELRLRAGHVGLFVGKTAARTTVPFILDWLHRHSTSAG